MFDWEDREQAEYSRSTHISFVELTKRSYLTASGTAPKRTVDPTFFAKAAAVTKLAQLISEGPKAGIEVPGFKDYRPYPVQAVWHGDDFKIWLKQPLFINETIYNQAVNQASLSELVNFEQLSEGTEMQTSFSGAVTATQVDGLQEEAKEVGYQLVDSGSHREVYLDGLPLTDDKQVLVRIPIDATGKRPPLAAVN